MLAIALSGLTQLTVLPLTSWSYALSQLVTDVCSSCFKRQKHKGCKSGRK